MDLSVSRKQGHFAARDDQRVASILIKLLGVSQFAEAMFEGLTAVT